MQERGRGGRGGNASRGTAWRRNESHQQQSSREEWNRRPRDPTELREYDLEDHAAVQREFRKKERKVARRQARVSAKSDRIRRQEEWARANKLRRENQTKPRNQKVPARKMSTDSHPEGKAPVREKKLRGAVQREVTFAAPLLEMAPTPPNDDDTDNAAPTAAVPTSVAVKYVPPAKRRVKKGVEEATRAICNKLTIENVVVMSKELGEMFSSGKYSRADVLESLCATLSATCISNPRLTPASALSYAGMIRALQLSHGNDIAGSVFAHLAAQLRKAVTTVGLEQEAVQAGTLFGTMYIVHCCDATLLISLLMDLVSGREGSLSSAAIQCSLAVLRVAGRWLRAAVPTALNTIASIVHSKFDSNCVTRDSVLADLAKQLAMGRAEGAAGAGLVDAAAVKSVEASLSDHVKAAHPSLAKRTLSRAVETMNTVGFSWEQCVAEEKPPRWYTAASSLSSEHTDESTRVLEGEASRPKQIVGQKRVREEAADGHEHGGATKINKRLNEIKALRLEEKAASGQRFSTEVKRQIFSVIASSSDNMECFQLLTQRDPNGATLADVAAVLLQCCSQEAVYNPFYALVMHRLLSANKKMKNLAQFAIWDRFKTMRFEAPDVGSYLNFACFLAYLFQENLYGLALLRGLDLEQPSRNINFFVRILFLRLLVALDPRALGALLFGGDVGSGNVIDFNSNTATVRKHLSALFSQYFVTEEESKTWIPKLWDVITFDLCRNANENSYSQSAATDLISSLPQRIQLANRALREGI